MAGLTDVPFRQLAWDFGAGYLVSEMVSSKPELWDTGKSRRRRIPVRGATPVAIQIAGTEPAVMAEAARRHVDEGVEVIDLNFGCPARKVCRKAAGSALLGRTDLVAAIVSAVAEAVDVPVTMKIRTGLEPGDRLGLAAAIAGCEAGAQMIVVHGRSRACRFRGSAEIAPVREIKSAVKVPVLFNGDIETREQLDDALAQSGADGVMIGRGAFGQPWIFSELLGLPVSHTTRLETVVEHVVAIHEFYGSDQGVRIARKHIIAYSQRPGFEHLDTRQLASLDDPGRQLAWLYGESRRAA